MRVGAGVALTAAMFIACGGSSKREGASASGGSGAVGGSSAAKGGTGGKGGTPTAAGGSGATDEVAGETGHVIETGGTDATGGTGGSVAATGGTTSEGGVGTGATGNAGGKGGGSVTGGKGGSGATGGKGGSGATGGTAGQAGMPSSPITSCNGDFPFIGTWVGNILDFYFNPIQPLTLEIYQQGDEVLGTLTYGGGDPPPPPTDADTPWPPGFWDDAGSAGRGPGTQPAPMPGVPYTVVRGAGCDTSFRFSIASTEAWEPWCELQTPLYTDGYGWACILRGNGASGNQDTCTTQTDGMELGTYPAWKCDACGIFEGSGVCACDEAGCYATNEPTQVFDLAYLSTDMDVLTGKDPDCADCTVRLSRVPLK